MGRTTGPDTARPMLHLMGSGGSSKEGHADGAVSADGRVRGSYVHGLFAADKFRHEFLGQLKERDESGLAYEAEIDRVLDHLADHLSAFLDLDRIRELANAR